MQPGEISEPVRTRFGYHIIRLEERREAGYQPLDDVRESIRRLLRRNKALEEARRRLEKARQELLAGKKGDEVAADYGLEYGKTNFFDQVEEIAGLGKDVRLNQAAFNLEEGGVSEPIEFSRGLVLLRLLERLPPHQGEFEEIRTKVEEILRREKARQLVKQKSQAIREALREDSFEQIATRETLEVKKPFELRRGGFLPGIGRLPETAEAALFAAETGTAIGPVELERGMAFLQVVEKKPADPANLEKSRKQLEQELLEQKRTALFQTWLDQLRLHADIERYLS